MLIIPGVIASSYPQVSTSYESIATVTVGAGGSSSITFSSIPSTYKHLQVRGILRSNRTGANFDYFYITLNAGAMTDGHNLYGNGGSALGENNAWAGPIAANNATTNVFGSFVLDLLDYTNTSKNRVGRLLGGCDNNGSGNIYLTSQLWTTTSAATSLTFTPRAGSGWLQNSTLALYGIMG